MKWSLKSQAKLSMLSKYDRRYNNPYDSKIVKINKTHHLPSPLFLLLPRVKRHLRADPSPF